MATRSITGTASGITTASVSVSLPAGQVSGIISTQTVIRLSAVVSIPPALGPRSGLTRLSGNAKIEIRTVIGATAVGDVWSDVACQVVSASATWGTSKSRGILSQGDPGTLQIDVYDPDRLLDPTNTSSPYYGILRPWLWVRLVFDNGTKRIVIKSGYVDSISHSISSQTGSIVANDWISLLANTGYPNAYVTGDLSQYSTLHTFASGILAQAITSANKVRIPITVEAEPSPKIAIHPYAPSNSPGSLGPAVWSQITDRAIAQLQFAYMDANNVIRFRDATYGHQPGISLGVSGPLPLDFVSAIDAHGIVNDVWVMYANTAQANWGGFNDESMLSVFQWGVKSWTSPPIPAKNPGLYDQNEYAALVRGSENQPSFEAQPLRIWPASVAELEQLVTLEAMQTVVMQFDSVSPQINLVGRSIGEAINIDADGWSVEMSTWIPR